MQRNEREAIIAGWKWFAIQIDRLDRTRNGEQFIRVIASERTKRITSANKRSNSPVPLPTSRWSPLVGNAGAVAIARRLLDEFLTCLAPRSRAVAFPKRSFAASWKAFECAHPSARRDRQSSANRSARDASKHLRVGREFFHEHQQSLNCFLWLVSGQTAADQINFFQLPRL